MVVPRRLNTTHSRQVASSEHITLHCCVSAAGCTMPPFIIFKSSFPGGNYTLGGPARPLYGKQKLGFMDSQLFVLQFKKIFLLFAKPTANRPVLLLLDRHIFQCSIEVIELAKRNDVILMVLAPHTTNLCQPLDVAVYKSFKAKMSHFVKLGQAMRGDLWIAKKDIVRYLKVPFEDHHTF